MTHYESNPAQVDGTLWRIAVIDSPNIPGARTHAALFLKDGAWHPGTLGAALEDSGPYGLPAALAPLYRKNRFPIEAALNRRSAPQATLPLLAEVDEAQQNQAAISRAARAQALDELDTAAAIEHGAGADLPLFLAV